MTIRRSLWFFAALFLAYNVALGITRPTIWYLQSNGGGNIAIAEEYVAGSAARDIVVVGSSLAARLDPEGLGHRIYNLSLAGGSAVTGLDIVLRSRPLPRMVVVESNVLRTLDRNFADARCHVLPMLLTRYLPSARVKYQPVNVLQNLLRGRPKPTTHLVNEKALKIGLDVQQSESAKVPDEAASLALLEGLAKQVDALGSADVKVVFVRLPIDESLVETPKEVFLRNAFDGRFPASRYRWLPGIPGRFPTVDGVHLADEATRRYTAALRPWIDRASD